MRHQPDDVLRHFRTVRLGIRRLAALAVSPAVERDHTIVGREVSEHARIHEVAVGVACVTVDQDDGRSPALFDIADANAVGIEEAIARAGLLRGDVAEGTQQQDADQGRPFPHAHNSIDSLYSLAV